jgi:SdpI/YfhL protein family
MLRILFIALPALTFALGIPLVLRLVPPNPFYGFRTTTTYSSADAWYQINFATGLAHVAAGAVAGLLVLFLSHVTFTLKPEVRYLAGTLFAGIITLAFLVPVDGLSADAR